MKLLIAGACIRPLVRSAIAAGHTVDAWDLFADWDTRQMCDEVISRQHSTFNQIDRHQINQLHSLDSLNSDCAATTAELAILAGGLEHRPEVVAALAEMVNVVGTRAVDLQRLQNFDAIDRALRESGCQIADRVAQLDPMANPADWLRKPRTSSGGLNVCRTNNVEQSVAALGVLESDIYFERFVPGQSWSALFYGIGAQTWDAGKERVPDGFVDGCQLLGCTRQWVGDKRLTDSPFAYCGSIGPLPVPESAVGPLNSLGENLATEFSIRGFFGVDFILNDQGVWPIDVNPRITSSAELFEIHQRAEHGHETLNLVSAQLGSVPQPLRMSNGYVAGKVIVFNQSGRKVTIDDRAFECLLEAYDGSFDDSPKIGTTISDVPCRGTVIPACAPLLTVRCLATTDKEAEQMLLDSVVGLRRGLAC